MKSYDEYPYIRAYVHIHPKAKLWGFFGQCLYMRLELAADRAGVLEIPEGLNGDLPRAVSYLIGCDDVPWVELYLPKLTAGNDPAVVHVRKRGKKEFLLLTSYCEAQHVTTLSNSTASRWSKQKNRDLQRAVELKLIDGIPAKTA